MRCESESRGKYWEQLFLFTRLPAWVFSLFSVALKASGAGGLLSLAKVEISRMTYLLATIKMCYERCQWVFSKWCKSSHCIYEDDGTESLSTARGTWWQWCSYCYALASRRGEHSWFPPWGRKSQMNSALPGGRRAISRHVRLRTSLPIPVGSCPTPS